MSILNQILEKYPESLEVFKIKGYDDVNCLLIHDVSGLIIFNVESMQQIQCFDEEIASVPLLDVMWALSMSFWDLAIYIAESGIVSISPDDELRKLENLMFKVWDAKKYLTYNLQLSADWSIAFNGVFESIWDSYPKDRKISWDDGSKNTKDKTGFIYVIELDSFVKVGFSGNIEQRMAQYRTSNLKVNLVKTFKGTMAQEIAFHKQNNAGSEKYIDTSSNVVKSLGAFLKQLK